MRYKKKLFDFDEKNTIVDKNIKTRTLIKDKLVKEKSKHNNLIEKIEIIWNCSNGVNNIIDLVYYLLYNKTKLDINYWIIKIKLFNI